MPHVASLLRLAVASPRKQFVDEGGKFDLAYVTPNLIVCSMPTANYWRSWYRISADDLRSFLYRRHGKHWKVWNFRAEDRESYSAGDFDYRVELYPFPDHHPPPFRLVPQIIQSIDKFLSSNPNNVAVLHCKAGQGRSGTMACAYLMFSNGITRKEAIDIFTRKRMRPGFGEGVSILSQRRYLGYVDQWIQIGQLYHSKMLVEIEEVVLYGMQYSDLDITCGTFSEDATSVVPQYIFTDKDIVQEAKHKVLLKPAGLKLYMGPDIHFSFMHLKRSQLTGLSLPSSTSYVWFNTFFETYCNNRTSFYAKWNQLDGFIGTHKRGSKALNAFQVSWRVVSSLPFAIQT